MSLNLRAHYVEDRAAGRCDGFLFGRGVHGHAPGRYAQGVDRYRVLSHTADTAIEAEGATLADLIENLAYGMFDLMFDLDEVASLDMAKVSVTAGSPEELVVDTLAELLTEAESQEVAFASFSARVDEDTLKARVIVAGSDVSNDELRGPPIKAVTYHDLEVTQRELGWYGRVVFDV